MCDESTCEKCPDFLLTLKDYGICVPHPAKPAFLKTSPVCPPRRRELEMMQRHQRYFDAIGKAIGKDRKLRYTGEPALSDVQEILEMKMRLGVAKIKLDGIRSALLRRTHHDQIIGEYFK